MTRSIRLKTNHPHLKKNPFLCPTMQFSDFNINKFLLRALEEAGFEEPTTIQEKVFAPVMSGKDIVGIAQTGTGKTFAYLLPLLSMWKYNKQLLPQILVVVPTRELVTQLESEIEKLTPYMNVKAIGVYGGANINTQKAKFADGADIVIGTPGRLVDLFLDGVLKNSHLKKVVIDEVDEMLNLGFRTQLKNIFEFLPAKRQNLMFSATIVPEVEAVIDQVSERYEKIEAAPSGAPLENIQQLAYEVPNFNSKVNLLEHLLASDESMQKVLVFVATKKFADALYERMLINHEDKMGVIHSSKAQNNRFASVANFQDGTYRFLIATDIIARGLDITNVTHVINFDLPDVAEKYIHRIGRTGRAEQEGVAISFISESDEFTRMLIEELMDKEIEMQTLPEEVELSEELISLEMKQEFVPFNNHKVRKKEPSGPAFHEKKAKNKKVNNKIRHVDKMRAKYGKPKTRGQKPTKRKRK